MQKVILIITSLFSLQLSAQDLVTLGPSTFQGAEGAIAVNIAAGEHNVQSSNFVYSAQGDYELTIISSSQSSEIASSASASIESGAFDNAGGYISANLAAGNSNQQHNTVIFSPESEVNWDTVDLSAQRASWSDTDSSTQNLNVELSPQALTNASGVIQISQIAGTGNTARNTFQMPTTIN